MSAITGWVELAEKRAPLERAVLAALEDVATHRARHPELGNVPTTRKAVERALLDREKDVTEREARLAEPMDARADAPDDERTADAELLRRSVEARLRLRARKPWLTWATASASVCAFAIAIFAPPVTRAAMLLVGGVMAVALLLLRRERRRHVASVHAMRRRDEARLEPAKQDHALLIKAARALGALDAFGATDDGRTLEDRESKLVALAPWIRELVSGFTPEQAARFS